MLRSTFSTVVVAVLLMACGCASQPAEIAPQATDALASLRAQLFTAKGQVQEASNAARDLVQQPRGELTPQMKRLNTAVTALNATREQAKEQGEAYKQSTAEYFAKWDHTLSTMSEETAERGRKRMQLAKDSISRLKQDASDIRVNLNPFMAEINEANTYLTTDTTKSGLEVVRPKLKTAVGREKDIVTAIDKMIADIDAIRAGK